ncbi:hypothetical protein [Candidatus Puniceispirillum sp.]|uniref:hypothetical protein n=1 Tax=Candidatus Puniceispirillum sp. TaxID=2026719 RepID=UPI001EB288F2|nr:hypothetical protein [Candidatus Puniceispirillum sp.]
MTFQQDNQLIEILRDMQRCPHLETFTLAGSAEICDGAIYCPTNGYAPRAFGGAKGNLDDVKVVIVSNGPTTPIYDEKYTGDPDSDLELMLSDQYMQSEPRNIHPNLKLFLDWVFPESQENLDEQLKHAWLTNSVHCTFKTEPRIKDRRRCANAYLVKALKLFTNPAVVLAGSKAQSLRSFLFSEITNPCIIECHSFSAPFAKGKNVAIEEWKNAARECQEYIKRRDGGS